MIISVALGRFIEGAKKVFSMLVKGVVRMFQGLRNVTVLLDSGVDFSFLSQRFVKKQWLFLEFLDSMGIACDGYRLIIYGYVTIPYKPKDSRGTTREMFQGFYTIDIAYYDVFLGRDQLVQVEPDIKWGEVKWYYCDTFVFSIEEVPPE